MEDLLVHNSVLPKSPLGKAIAYSLNKWEGLRAYTQDGKRLRLKDFCIFEVSASVDVSGGNPFPDKAGGYKVSHQ